MTDTKHDLSLHIERRKEREGGRERERERERGGETDRSLVIFAPNLLFINVDELCIKKFVYRAALEINFEAKCANFGILRIYCEFFIKLNVLS